MSGDLMQLSAILSREMDSIRAVYAIEEEKSDAIEKHDGKKLEALSLEEEEILMEISRLEIERETELRKIVKTHNITGNSETTLGDITSFFKSQQSAEVHSMGREIRDILIKLDRLKETNDKLIRDNLEYYEILVNGLKNTGAADKGYGSDGKEKGTGPYSVLFNQTV